MILNHELERKSTALIEQARKVLHQALLTDPTNEEMTVQKLIARAELVREAANKSRLLASSIRTQAKTLSRKQRMQRARIAKGLQWPA